jgi:hypothetical protein
MTDAPPLQSRPFRLDRDTLSEAADQVLVAGEGVAIRRLWAGLSVVELALAMLGAVALTGLILDARTMALPLIAGAGVGLVLIVLRQRGRNRVIRLALRSRAAPVDAVRRITPDGLGLTGGGAVSALPRALVDAVMPGPRGLTFCAGGSFVFLPWAAVDEPGPWLGQPRQWWRAAAGSPE